MRRPIGIYVHVPYCRVACPYCDFVKKPTVGAAPDAFTTALCQEILHFDGPRDATSVFFGGGTPSLLKRDALATILDTLRRHFRLASDAEIGMEVNPDDVTRDIADAWLDLGVNRVTIGVQSFDDRALRYLGRCHDAEVARRACSIVAERFENWGLDLIFGAPPVEAWETSLDKTLALDPKHISTYGLTYERNTPFWTRRHEAVDDDTSLATYRIAMETLATYDHYEVSNFAKNGYQSRHNRIYWRNEEYVGFGPGAYSFLGTVRARNHPAIDRYLDEPGRKQESLMLSPEEIRTETLLQHFRTRAGMTRAYYTDRFGTAVDDDFGATIDGLVQRGLLESKNGTIRPTRLGYELNDEIGLALVS